MGKNTVKTKAGRRRGKPGARWAKGQSCASNPEVTKYRDQASSSYYHQVRSNPLLTADNLTSSCFTREDLEDDVLSDDIQSLTVSDARSIGLSSIVTTKTFASNWSKCSNKAFESFLNKCKLDSALHKDMLSILAATSEIINDLGGTHKETDYFASFVMALEKCESEQYPAMLALVSIIVGKIPKAVVRRKFEDFYPKIGSILEDAIVANDSTLIRMCCEVLKKSVAVQDPSFLKSNLPVHNVIYSILRCANHENPKVRKKARAAVDFIINQQNEMKSPSFTFVVIGWVLDQLCSYPTCGAKPVVDSLSLLQHIWPNVRIVPSVGAKKLFESILRAMSSGDVSILKIGFMFFSTMFQTNTVEFTLPDSDNVAFVEGLNAKLVTALWEFQPNWRNDETFISWIQSILNGLVRLSLEQVEVSYQYIPLILDAISPTWSATFGAVSSQVVADFFPHLVNSECPAELIGNCFKILSKNLIALPPNQNCLFVLRAFLESLDRATFDASPREVFLQLVPLRTIPGVEKILGGFLTAFGVESIWTSVDPEVQRTIILPLVRNNISDENISFWSRNILPLMGSATAAEASIKFLIWDSFVGFCTNPADPANFPAELVGKTIVNNPDVRLSALAALKQVLKWPQAKSVVDKYSKNYLPILFNLYVKEKCTALSKKSDNCSKINEGHAEAIALAIQEYLALCDQDFVVDLTEKAIKKYVEAPNDTEKSPILDLLSFLVIVSSDDTILEKVFKLVAPLVNHSVQMKRTYRVLVGILKNPHASDNLKSTVAVLLKENKGKTKSNAEPFRLECLLILAVQNKTWFLEFVPEAILNLQSVNVKSRKVAIKFTQTLSETLKENKTNLETVMKLIDLGLRSPSAFTCTCTLRFLSLLYRALVPENPIPDIVNRCINLIVEKMDSSVSNEAFRFLSLVLAIHKGKTGPFAAGIGKAIASGGLPRKDTNKVLARMIKIFGEVGLKSVLPNSSDPKMHRRIKNIQKKLRKMKLAKQGSSRLGTKEKDEVSDDEGYTDEVIGNWTGTSSKSVNVSEKLMIKEDIVDFLDPRNITSSIISKPKATKKDCDEFEISSDGKLIIQDGSKKSGSQENDDEDEEFNEMFKRPAKGRKRKLTGPGSTASSRRSVSSVNSKRSGKQSNVSSKRPAPSVSSSKKSSKPSKRPAKKFKIR